MNKLGSTRRINWLAALMLVPAGAALPIQAVAAAPAPAWAVNMASSKLRFQSSMAGEKFTGAFERWKADIRFDPRNLAQSSVTVRVDMASAKTGSSDRDEALPGDDWFAASKFAQATFAARTFKDLGGGRYQAIGMLTIRGVSRPLMLPFTLRIQGDQAQMSGSATIDRHVFGVGQGQFAGPDSIPFAVQVGVSIIAKRI